MRKIFIDDKLEIQGGFQLELPTELAAVVPKWTVALSSKYTANVYESIETEHKTVLSPFGPKDVDHSYPAWRVVVRTTKDNKVPRRSTCYLSFGRMHDGWVMPGIRTLLELKLVLEELSHAMQPTKRTLKNVDEDDGE